MNTASLLQSSLDANIVTNSTLDEDSTVAHDVAWCTSKHIQNNQQKGHDVEEENMVNMNKKDPPVKKSQQQKMSKHGKSAPKML